MNISRLDPTLGTRFESIRLEPHQPPLGNDPFRQHMQAAPAAVDRAAQQGSSRLETENRPSAEPPRREETPPARDESRSGDADRDSADTRPSTSESRAEPATASQQDSPHETPRDDTDQVTVSAEAEQQLEDEPTSETVTGEAVPTAGDTAEHADAEPALPAVVIVNPEVKASAAAEEPLPPSATSATDEPEQDIPAAKSEATRGQSKSDPLQSAKQPTAVETKAEAAAEQADATTTATTANPSDEKAAPTVSGSAAGKIDADAAAEVVAVAARPTANGQAADDPAAEEEASTDKPPRTSGRRGNSQKSEATGAGEIKQPAAEANANITAKPSAATGVTPATLAETLAATAELPAADAPGKEAAGEATTVGKSETAQTQATLERQQGTRFAEKLLHPHATRKEGTGEVRHIDQGRFVQRVAGAFARAQQRDGEIRLRLSPPELGSLRLQLKIEDGAMTARLEAETSAARGLLLENLPALRERLAEQNIRIERFEVEIQQDPQTGTGQGQQRDPQAEQRAEGNRGRLAEASSAEQGLAPSEPEQTSLVTDKQINIIV